mmetsp:Transcript_27309/g.32296  ORF Transcript_27309/g.32296 Transcript_27309/m.32296 type:complete len:301 (-) Transcript_27309:222-1124(-)|eukprot:CAMPEP_0198251702 /NCGR_PEP_ID=MMETSP1447-20131203/2451_1 /TAXON_ID=420782 /ORGANISM="Chaetoceros dichaeta, Strain CCMP1751" /LENGTH=300 /DNA_ID=CAMNT_0043936787 /DNA_START=40 /DNA_END=942 /DNA_ORIENTATION=-
MAKHLARIHGTEEDKVNCPFYFKIGACRHADRCSRIHHRPAFSPTILIKHIFRHPIREAELKALSDGLDKDQVEVDRDKAMEDFLQFFENLYEELGKFGRIESLHVCDNLGDHMIGHVYAKFSEEEEASDALNIMDGRYYDGRKMEVEFSPVTDFREARCRDFDEDTCNRGGFCNFMHIKPVPMCLIRSLEDDCEEERRREDMKRAEREHRDRSRRKRRHRERQRGGGRRKRHSRHDGDSDEERGNGGDSDTSRSRSRSPKRRQRSYSRSRSRSMSRSRSRSNSRTSNNVQTGDGNKDEE